MQIGCCTNMHAREGDAVGQWTIDLIAESGFDYLDLPVVEMSALTDGEFTKLVRRVADSGLSCRACNNFLPAELQLTGPSVDLKPAGEYLHRALDRIDRLGAKIICFGSAGARNVPAEFSRNEASQQLVEFLHFLDELVTPRGITIVIEPLNRSESNIVTSAAEGLELSRKADRPSIRLLVDYYHLRVEEENPAIIAEAGNALQHCHIANPRGRGFPAAEDGEDYQGFFRALRDIGYGGSVSLEAYSGNFAAEAPQTLQLLRELASF